jgi:molybdopterin-guanine dinucleotide biosynthesis protein MobB
MGLKVAVIKHDGHDFEPDVPRTDSFMLRQAGAYGAAVYSSKRFLVTRTVSEITPSELAWFFPEASVILLEGGKNTLFPKIEVLRQGYCQGPVGREPYLALCTDGPWLISGVPVVALDDYPRLANIIVSIL